MRKDGKFKLERVKFYNFQYIKLGKQVTKINVNFFFRFIMAILRREKGGKKKKKKFC